MQCILTITCRSLRFELKKRIFTLFRLGIKNYLFEVLDSLENALNLVNIIFVQHNNIMSTPKIEQSNNEILEIFKELQEKAKTVNPDLLSDIKSFNENHVALESYQNFINVLNQPPILTSSNHVSQ
jgi:monomeric isocitrate dehydrogenase